MAAKKKDKKKINYENGLRGREISSKILASDITTVDKLKDDIAGFVKNIFQATPGMGVFYLDYGILFGKWQKGAWQFHPQQTFDVAFLQEARIFNEDRELKIWRTEEGYRYRLRDDTEGEPCFVVEAQQYLWGTRAQNLGNEWSKLTEDRGTELIVPFAVEHTEGISLPLACVLTHNYVGYLGNNQATYVDCRFVKIEKR